MIIFREAIGMINSASKTASKSFWLSLLIKSRLRPGLSSKDTKPKMDLILEWGISFSISMREGLL